MLSSNLDQIAIDRPVPFWDPGFSYLYSLWPHANGGTDLGGFLRATLSQERFGWVEYSILVDVSAP